MAIGRFCSSAAVSYATAASFAVLYVPGYVSLPLIRMCVLKRFEDSSVTPKKPDLAFLLDMLSGGWCGG